MLPTISLHSLLFINTSLNVGNSIMYAPLSVRTETKIRCNNVRGQFERNKL